MYTKDMTSKTGCEQLMGKSLTMWKVIGGEGSFQKITI
jgi:hypothetical protein